MHRGSSCRRARATPLRRRARAPASRAATRAAPTPAHTPALPTDPPTTAQSPAGRRTRSAADAWRRRCRGQAAREVGPARGEPAGWQTPRPSTAFSAAAAAWPWDGVECPRRAARALGRRRPP
eukprot:365267-Chlamydomonas_euryale.AAC.6